MSAGHDRYVSGKSKQNAIKALAMTDAQGRLLFAGVLRPGRCPDVPRPVTLAWPDYRPSNSTSSSLLMLTTKG